MLSYGLGADSTAILLRWLTDPTSRDFALEDLIVITAMTGDEFTDTRELVEAEILPRLAAHRVRYVQIARGGPTVGDGVVVLDDSRSPYRLYAEGVYKLADELFSGGTVPQVARGRRTCSIKQKGIPLDTWIRDNVVGPYRHVMGFNAEEVSRAERDTSYSNEVRGTEYPLIAWGWGRERLLKEIEAIVRIGRPWPKSCCSFCPFANDNHLSRYVDEPAAAVQAMLMEHVSLALNPRVALFGETKANRSTSVQALVEAALPDVADEFYRHVASAEHAVYDIRRVFHAKRTDPTKKGSSARSVRRLFTGSPVACFNRLRALALELGGETPVTQDGIMRAWINHQHDGDYPRIERFLVVAPSLAIDKERASFDTWWTDYSERSTSYVVMG